MDLHLIKLTNVWWVVLAIVFLIKKSTGLHCYQCGVDFSQDAMWLSRGTGDKPDEKPHASSDSFCFDYDEQSHQLHSYYESVTCDPGHLCAKVVTKHSGQNRFTVQRGCVLAVKSNGESHRISCGPLVPNLRITNETFEHICFCDTNFCNSAPTPGRFQSSTSLFFIFPVFLWIYTILINH